jgi:hypothetical protein
VALGLTTGCETTGLSRREQANVTYPNYILNLRPKSPGAQPRLTTPLRLAVVQVGEPAPPKAMLDQLQSDHSLVTSAVGLPSWGETRGQSNHTEVVFEQVQAICRLAQSVGASHVLIFGGNMNSWSDGNALRLFDLTLVAGVLVPSTKVVAEGKAAGTLIDTSTCEPVLLVSTDAKRSVHSPTQLADGKTETLRVALRDELTSALADELLRTLAGRKDPAVASHAGRDPAQSQ